MDDSTAMTVEFLRARLLSERSVSKDAKQRADELAKKVIDLEEQLKVATLQREKAEKATVEVLEILENNGICDFSGSFDSNSDQEQIHFESKEDKTSAKEDKSRKRLSKNELEEIPGSDHEGSSSCSRSLSWKSCRNSPSSLEKKKTYFDSKRMQCNFVSPTDSSTKLRRGKSCRKIKRNETMPITDQVRDECVLHHAEINREASGSGNNSDCTNDKLEVLKGNNNGRVHDGGQDSQENPPQGNNESPVSLKAQTDGATEYEVEKQAELIGQYEAEEKAQREWEERFEANESHTLDSCEHGNQSNITEAREEPKEIAEPPNTISSQGQEAELEGKEVCHIREALTKVHQYSPSPICLRMESSQDQQCNIKRNIDAHANSEFSFPSQEIPGSTAKTVEKEESSNIESQEDWSQHSGESSSQNDLQLAIWQEKPNELDDVLEALQRAKLSLKHELNKPSLTTPGCPVSGSKGTLPDIIDSMAIPNSCAGLFRVPTDLAHKTMTQMNFSPSHFESKAFLNSDYPEVGISRSDQYSTRPNFEIGQIDSALKPYFDPWMDMELALPASSRYKYPSYADLMPRMSWNGVSQTLPSVRRDMVIGDHSPFQNNHNRSSMCSRY